MNLTVIIPVYNEADHINEILKRVQSTKLAKEIIVVDDGSKDGTREAPVTCCASRHALGLMPNSDRNQRLNELGEA